MSKKATSVSSVKMIRKLGWGSGVFADVIMANAFSYLANPIYNVALHVDPRLIGWAMGLPRVWDAITDPIMGNISDNTRSRWGRRRPYVLAGAILSGLIFALVWNPPGGWSPKALGLYFLAISFLYFTAYTIFSIPWNALGLELTDDYHERTGVQAVKTFLQAVGGMSLGMMWWLAIKIGRGDDVLGIRWVGVIFGIVIIGSGIVSAWSGKERVMKEQQERIAFMPAVKATFRNSAFMKVAGVLLCVLVGLFLIQPMALYINIFHVYGGNKEPVAHLNMIMNFIFQGVGLALTPLVAMVSRRFGKKNTLSAGLLFVALGYFISWWTYTPQMPYLQMLTLGLCAPGLSCLWILTPSMVADLCDLDELHTGRRREGMYMATYTWVIKAGLALSMVLSGYLLQGSGYRAEAVEQAAGVITKLRLFYMIIPTVFTIAAFVLARKYPLTEERSMQIRKELDSRKGSSEGRVG